MPTLLDDLAAESAASNRRVAARLNKERRELSELRRASSSREPFVHGVFEARQATDDALSRLMQAEVLWRSALATLRQAPTADDAVGLLRTLLQVFESGDEVVQSVRALWQEAEKFGAAAERLDDLDQAATWFKQQITDAQKAIEHRIRPWQPADPERFARELKLAREGKTVTADEARAWFRRTDS